MRYSPPARRCANIIGRSLNDMVKVNIDPFSSGTEFDIWNERNCERCVKASRYKGETLAGYEYTKCRCSIQRDIFTRMYSNEPISQRTIDVCGMIDCPNRLEHYKKYEKHSKYPKLFEL